MTSPPDADHPDADSVGEYLISSRSFREYEAMFMLTKGDLHGRVLDCPGGASSFTAEASVLGAIVSAVDPVYAMSASSLRELVMGEPDRGSAHTAAGFDRYLWEFYGDIEGHRGMRRRSAALFARDIEENPERYVPASLPVLPFEDHQFDLVLLTSSNAAATKCSSCLRTDLRPESEIADNTNGFDPRAHSHPVTVTQRAEERIPLTLEAGIRPPGFEVPVMMSPSTVTSNFSLSCIGVVTF
jgi:hypothetical protein